MADLGERLTCVICLETSKDLVLLPCSHGFCQICIKSALGDSGGSNIYTCPECKAKFDQFPPLNRKLHDTVAQFYAPSTEEKRDILCTYCMESPVPAVKSCLQCEISMCGEHLTAHNFVDHVLIPPKDNFNSRKCPFHNKFFKYYCPRDRTCVCASCMAGPHKGHKVKTLKEAFEEKKEKLKNMFKGQMLKREDFDRRIQSLVDRKTEAQESAGRERRGVLAMFDNFRSAIEFLEQKSSFEVSRQAAEILGSVSDLIKELETKKQELSSKMNHTEQLCRMSDPVAFLQHPQSGDEDLEKDDKEPVADDLDHILISLTLYRAMKQIIRHVIAISAFSIVEASGLLLNVNTAHDPVDVSEDLKTAFLSGQHEERPYLLERFQGFNQVMSIQGFYSGAFYWEVEISHGGLVDVGMGYLRMPRHGDESAIGGNGLSWGIRINGDELLACHNGRVTQLHTERNDNRIGIYLDYDGGTLSFFFLGDPIRRIHTFRTTFTGALYGVFGIEDGAWVKILS
ncbi:E3 ubiquitin/ISG15 ligase TRIM25-like [Hyperolius riggenbachi]|uniref:E3 ubiquitin/ISG15 ligase TRIM25-like n=1 Tax=Hyperolius riggenbachi TaxID=752182 RepID=UPI0035A2EAD3